MCWNDTQKQILCQINTEIEQFLTFDFLRALKCVNLHSACRFLSQRKKIVLQIVRWSMNHLLFSL
jgi:hypothetical protein